MKEKREDELGSWKHVVTTADGTWQTRGWHSKNAIRNYLNGALLYYHHLCQKGRDKAIQEELYLGTSKSAEGFAARVTFTRATLPPSLFWLRTVNVYVQVHVHAGIHTWNKTHHVFIPSQGQAHDIVG